MTTAWRIIPEDSLTHAFSGEGARLYGGRWNHIGIPVVYLSEHLSLAVLELFVNVELDGRYMRFTYIRVEIPPSVKIKEILVKDLPKGWDDKPVAESTKDIGTEWAQKQETAVLKVPSAVLPVEFNYVVNPMHPDFSKLKKSRPEPYNFDERMWKV